MRPEIRKIVACDKEVFVEGVRRASRSWRTFAVAAVVHSPWSGRFVANLKSEIQALSPVLDEIITDRVITLAGGANAIQADGKAAVAGLDSEIEHASGPIHTLRFGNHFRRAVSAKSYLAFSNTRGPARTPVTVPLMDKNVVGRRSHYLTVQFAIPDAPRADEIVVVLRAATSGRPRHRIGDGYRDLKDLGHDVEKPTSI